MDVCQLTKSTGEIQGAYHCGRGKKKCLFEIKCGTMKTLEICTSFSSDAQRFHATVQRPTGGRESENVCRVCIKDVVNCLRNKAGSSGF